MATLQDGSQDLMRCSLVAALELNEHFGFGIYKQKVLMVLQGSGPHEPAEYFAPNEPRSGYLQVERVWTLFLTAVKLHPFTNLFPENHLTVV